MAIFFLFLSFFLFIYSRRIIIQRRHISPTPSSLATSTTAQPQVKYDVFLSFRGEDTRAGFISHLYAALKGKQVLTFIDYQLVRGDEISTSLMKTIEEAKLSVIVFSENYASSKWCLEELVKIFECRKNNGQIVIPVFYWVDPSHVRNQKGSFGDEFARLIKEKALKMDKVKSFKDALMDAANLSGWSLGESELESEFIEKITRDVLNKLHTMSSNHTTDLFGIDDRVNKVESLLNMESQDVLIVRIWGMVGIGKTKIAEAVCEKVRSRFEGIFVANFTQEYLKTGSVADLQRSFLSQLLGKEIRNMGTLSFRDSFIRDRLRRKKVFIVLDDVDGLFPLEEWEELLRGRHNSFAPGSKVLITSRDKQVLNNVVDETYEVEILNSEEALQLFSSKALKNCNPTIDHGFLIKRIANYVRGNPLALIVLGSALYGKSTEEWHSALNKLSLNPRIENVLKISYNGLDQEQKFIFLDIAHFFRRWEKNSATRILDAFYDRSVIFDIHALIDKCLITTSYNMLGMHDLVQQMAFSIVREENKLPGKRSRLCHPPDVVRVLEGNKGTEKIEGLSLDMSQLSRQIQLKSNAFSRIDGLRFLQIYFRHFSEYNIYRLHLPPSGLDYLSNKLRYFRWDGFPVKFLPQNFRAEHLVEVILRESNVEKLWTEVQNLVNLRTVILDDSLHLTELPDLWNAKNLEVLSLEGCKSLTEISSSLQYLDKLKSVNLKNCSNLRSLPRRFDSEFLEQLTLTGCSNITKCPEISRNVRRLELSVTGIRELPQSISKLEYLEILDLSDCTQLSSLPTDLYRLKSLTELNLRGCSKLESFPEIMEPMESLARLYLTDTAVKALPPSIQFLTGLNVLGMSNCTRLLSLPTGLYRMKSLTELNLTGCSKLESFPEIMEPMESLGHLSLSGTAIKEVPPSIQLLTGLEILGMKNCTQLSSLPSSIYKLKSSTCLPSNLYEWESSCFDLNGCTKLESLPEIMEPVEYLRKLNLTETAIKELPSSIHFFKNLEGLNATGCTQLSSLPLSIYRLNSLKVLYLGKTGIKELSRSIKNLTDLKSLELHGTPIKEIPELPPCLENLRANDCESLETLSSTNLSNIRQELNFVNCFKLDQKGLLDDMQLKIQSGQFPKWGMQILLPGSEISEWWGDQGVGSSVTIHTRLPSDRPLLIGITFCLVFVLVPPFEVRYDPEWHAKGFIGFDWFARSKGDGEVDWGQISSAGFKYTRINDLDHVLLLFEPAVSEDHYSSCYGTEVTFEFYPRVENCSSAEKHEIQKRCRVKRCAVRPIFSFVRPTFWED